MTKQRILKWSRFALLTAAIAGHGLAMADEIVLGRLQETAQVSAYQVRAGAWGLRLAGAGDASLQEATPILLELWDDTDAAPRVRQVSYQTVARKNEQIIGQAEVTVEDAKFFIEDCWAIEGEALRCERQVRVQGRRGGGYATGMRLSPLGKFAWPQLRWFMPGILYGGSANITPEAMGGRAFYRPGAYAMRVREDRLPAPLVLAMFPDGQTLSLLNPRPVGETTAEEGSNLNPGVAVSEKFRFGAIGAEEGEGGCALGYWFPGSEGEVTYEGYKFPDGQMHAWRRRYHPVVDGATQTYTLCWRLAKASGFPQAYAEAWRWAWSALQPKVNAQNIEKIRHSIVDALAGNVIEVADRAGVANAQSAVRGAPGPQVLRSVMGFTGKALESAEFLLAEAALDPSARGQELRRKGEKIIASFLRLPIDPPAGEGFRIDTGVPVWNFPARGDQVFLRSFGDDIKALLRAYEREQRAGRSHPEWLQWCQRFGRWLLTIQQPAGGFPRTWAPGSGKVVSASPNSSFNAVPLLVLLTKATGDRRYVEAAVRAAEFTWHNGQSEGRFIGGTIDNPDVIDKEAGTLSLEAYLALHDYTQSPIWLARAEAAAMFSATWIYLWDVPMPADANPADLDWKPGLSTVGLQLIATGHSLVDAYMAFDADEYAQLHALTQDPFYRQVAAILLHNTKVMVQMPERDFGLKGDGWQQEHWSLAPRRGQGRKRLWLPWVATSQLNGIFGMMEKNPALYQALTQAAGPAPAKAARAPSRTFPHLPITVDGRTDDWRAVPRTEVATERHLWFGQGMVRENWRGPEDLSYRWAGAWYGERVYFLVEVRDDHVVPAGREASYLCDCVEIYLDPTNAGGRRVRILDGRDDWFAKYHPAEMQGYELHFLPTPTPLVFVDHAGKYSVAAPQNQRFRTDWQGEAAMQRTAQGYLVEVGLKIPGLVAKDAAEFGLEIGVCDDDGAGRKSILMWTGTKADFWISMDHWGTVRLETDQPPPMQRER